ncbi:MAG: alpha/beta hydrolase [Alphaproteobacteria bacterium]
MKIAPLLRFFAFAITGYAALVGALYLGQRRMMYFPDASVPSPAMWGVPEMQPVALDTADGLRLLAWYRAAAEGRPTLVYLHGNAGHIGYRGEKVRAYLDAGYGVLLLSWRGYGGNPGSPSEDGLYHDGRAALAFLAGEAVPPARVVLYGESLGGGVAVQMASEQRVGALVLEAPFTSLADVAARHYWYVPARRLVRDRFESIAKIARIGAPLFIFHGEEDRIIPVALARQLFAAAAEPKEARYFPAAGHNDLYDHGAAQAVLDFLGRTFE